MEMTLEPVQLQQKDSLISILVRELFDKYCITDRLVDSYKFPRVLSLDMSILFYRLSLLSPPSPPPSQMGLVKMYHWEKTAMECKWIEGEGRLVSKETVVLHQWGSITRWFGLTTELVNVNWPLSRVSKLMFWALALYYEVQL